MWVIGGYFLKYKVDSLFIFFVKIVSFLYLFGGIMLGFFVEWELGNN